jgi:hypothetical protein
MVKRTIEKSVVKRINKSYKGELEVITPVGRIDILTSNRVIEVKKVEMWKSALGQVLSYGYYYRKRKKILYLYGSLDNVNCVEILRVCAKYKVEVIFEKIDTNDKKSKNSK